MKAFPRTSPLKVLSDDEVRNIHTATLEVLEHTGVVIREESALALLEQAGAAVDYETNLVRIPGRLVEDAVAKTPKSFVWHARNPKHSIRVGGEPTKFGPVSGGVNIIDLETGECRAPTLRDTEQQVRLIDALENISHNYPPASHTDVSTELSDIHCVAVTVKNTSKCILGESYARDIAHDSVRVAAALAGGEDELRKKPTIAAYIDPISPLAWDEGMLGALMEYASYGQLIFMTVMAMAGGTAPATLAGLLVQQNAEILSGLLIAHLVNPRAPVVYGNVSCPMDMRTGDSCTGAPEVGLLNAASVQLAKHYGMPCSVTAQTSAKLPDAQASYEKMTSLMMGVMAGADFVDLVAGTIENFRTASYEQLVIDDELAGMAGRCAAGFEVSAETLALEVIDRVGPGGNYLADKHTTRWFRQEHYRPKLSDRSARADWEIAGSKDIRERARERAREILASHEPDPIDPAVWSEIERIVAEADERGAKG
jgi:trimethylamine--corrinoid protein Co-methyltransferase